MGCFLGVICIFRDFDHFGVLSGVEFGQIGADSGAESGGIWPMYGHQFSEKGVNGREGVL